MRKKHTNPNCQCASCKSKRGEYKGNKATNYKDGHCINNVCKDCGIKIHPQATRCKKCYSIFESISRQGINSASFIDGRSSNKHYCIEGCGNEISYPTAFFGNGRCNSCHIKNIWKNHRDMMSKKIIQGLIKTPNKPEKKLLKLLPKSFKYVGNGKVIIKGFNPDFIDIKNKKIIELFGDYWHNLKNWKQRDNKKINIYKNLGYKVLVIWEKELKDLNYLSNKIYNFIRKS
jgi:G:T-mismatch repair DNA endonuclease (very short patch repair protein)